MLRFEILFTFTKFPIIPACEKSQLYFFILLLEYGLEIIHCHVSLFEDIHGCLTNMQFCLNFFVRIFWIMFKVVKFYIFPEQ